MTRCEHSLAREGAAAAAAATDRGCFQHVGSDCIRHFVLSPQRYHPLNANFLPAARAESFQRRWYLPVGRARREGGT